MVVTEIETIEEWWEMSNEPSQKNPHTEHARASFDWSAVSKSFPYAFHLPSPQYKVDMVSVRDLQNRRKTTPSKNHLKLQQPAHRPNQPLASRPTSLDSRTTRAKFEKVFILPTLFNGLMSACGKGQSKQVDCSCGNWLDLYGLDMGDWELFFNQRGGCGTQGSAEDTKLEVNVQTRQFEEI